MSNTNAYIIFEPDQVLTNDHLNEMFDYLDVQERLTRNKLIGIGIVCGLQIDNLGQTISISKGCGVTSKGYLIVWDDAELTQYVNYTLPASPLYTPFRNEATGKQYPLLRMVTNEEAAKIEGGKKPVGPVLKNKIAVLFLEANEKDLKNCDTQDCNDKGRMMELTVRPLLIDKADMEAIIIKQKKLSGEDGLSNSYIERLGLKDIAMKRFDVKATPLVDAYDIFDAYLACFDNDVLGAIASAYSQCFSIFQPILNNNGNTNPFNKLEADLKAKLEYIKKSMPIYIQYYYDFLDDLVKAYYEFREASFEVVTDCCPDEDLFPMHLMLGQAEVDTVDDIRTPYRQYFISSPLFNNQTNLLNEVKVLFDRMVNLTKSFFIPTFNLRTGVPIRITPSMWGNAPLSRRSIPYYYNINGVNKTWSPIKSRKGQINQNLSYNADKYNTAAPEQVTNPLQFGIEHNDFYRIEGHIGQNYLSALNVILSTRNTNRLPFDVIALKAGTNAADTEIKYDCHFQDLEAQFTLLRAELACKMHEPLCIAAKVPSLLRFTTSGTVTNFSFLSTLTQIHSLAINDIVSNQARLVTNFVQVNRFTTKGDFLKTYCPVTENTLGNDYIKSANKFFPRPSQIDLQTTSGARAALMHLIDITEALMQTITGASTIYNFRYANFNRIYVAMISFFTDFMQAVLAADNEQKTLNPMMYGMLEAVVTGCMDEKIKALVDEYARRVEKIQKQNLLSEYLKSNPGIDHKAGVPRGGTFILVYHDAPATTATAATNTLTNLANANTTATLARTTAIADTGAVSTKLADTSVMSKSNLDKIISLFNTTSLQLTTVQSEALRRLTLQQFTAAVAKTPFNIPDNAVVADFYLPYLCCSDCPPVTYVLPKVPQDTLLLSLEKTSFCNNDGKAYKVTVNPVGGSLTASAGGVKADTMEFRPQGLVAGVNKITYTLPDGRSTSVDVTITAAFEINFDFSNTQEAPLTYQFFANNIENKTVVWNFGDGTATSNEQKPTHSFAVSSEVQTFIVTLTATDGPCVIERKQEIRVQRPKDQVFTIEPNIFCSNDRKAYTFTANPQIDDIAKIENPDNLVLEKGADGNVFFIPAKQSIAANKRFSLLFKGAKIELSIVAIFQVDFVAQPVDASPLARRFVATNVEGKAVEWDFGDGTPVSKEPQPVHGYKISDNVQTFSVSLTVTDGPCTVITKKAVVIERQIPQVFDIETTTFCSNDDKRYVFSADPVINNIADIENPDGLLMDQNANKQVFFIPAKQDIPKNKAFKLSYKGQSIQISIIAISAAQFKVASVATSATARLFTAIDVDGKNVEWNFGDGTPVTKEPSVVHDFKLTDNVQTFNVTLTVSDGPCKASSNQQVIIETARDTVFALQPLNFCANDKNPKVFTIDPLPASTSEIKNPDKLAFEINSTAKQLFFIPAKQAIKSTKSYTVSFGNKSVKLTILVPDASFAMDIKRNTSPIAVFPTLLSLRALQKNADSYLWTLKTQFGTVLTFENDEVNNLDLNRFRDPNMRFTPISIVLVVNYNKSTQTECGDDKDYNITVDVINKFLNKGEFDNLSKV